VKAEADYKRAQGLMKKGLMHSRISTRPFRPTTARKPSTRRGEASLNQAEESLRKTTITSPMDGTISQLNNQLGERVLGTQQFQGRTS